MADFQRRKHGQISKERLLSWIEKKDKLGMGYSTIDIPNRLLQMIGNIAGSHSASLDTVMGLETVDTGFANDYVHPRFLAVLLQLGDALDMDNGRFHPLTKEYLGQLPESSEVHFRKHKAIQRLFISNQKIQIEADCEKQEELRLIRSECNWIRKLLERAAAAWSEIRPEGSSVALPTFDTPHLKYRGLDIPDNLVEAKFLISQKRAFELIKGSNIYRDRYVFLRELIQNAVDATKLQYFRTVLRKGRLEKGEAANCSPAEMAAIVRPDGYPIEVTLSLAKGKNGVGQVLLREEEAERGTDEEIGVLIQVRDYGTGISQSDIAQIGRVGTSYESRKAEIDSMPKWLKPTGMFGIGLQSIFLLTGKFRATTHTRQEEDYDITFYSHHGNDGGYINVTPGQDEEEHLRAYGTCFEVFIPNSRLHPSGFAEDIFNSAYLEQEELALARQVMMEMAEYLSNLFVNALFPLTLELRDVGVRDQETQEQHYKGLQDRAFQAMQFQLPFFGKNGWGFPQTVSKRPLFWAYQIDKPEELYHDEKGNVCRLDVKEGRLYIFNQCYNTYASMGIQRILKLAERVRREGRTTKQIGMDVYYKGIRVSEQCFRYDANLIELIDIKDKLESRYIELNRNSFSEEGKAYLETVYQDTVALAREALKDFGRKEGKGFSLIAQLREQLDILLKQYTEAKEKRDLNRKEEAASEMKEKEGEKLEATFQAAQREVENFLLSITALAYFAMVDEKDEFFASARDLLSAKEDEERNTWNELIKYALEKMHSETVKFKSKSMMFNLFYQSIGDKAANEYSKEAISEDRLSMLDVINKERKFAIVSTREPVSRFWVDHLVELGERHDEIKKNILQLRYESDMETRQKLMAELEKRSADLSALYTDMTEVSPNSVVITNRYNVDKELMILRWLLENIPTMAMFTSVDENARISILDMDICGSIYLDINMRKLTVDRMLEKHRQNVGNRFGTRVWSGYRYLTLKNWENRLAFIKRGKIAIIGSGEMIFPLTAEELQNVDNEIHGKAQVLLKAADKINEGVSILKKQLQEQWQRQKPETAMDLDLLIKVYTDFLALKMKEAYTASRNYSREEALKEKLALEEVSGEVRGEKNGVDGSDASKMTDEAHNAFLAEQLLRMIEDGEPKDIGYMSEWLKMIAEEASLAVFVRDEIDPMIVDFVGRYKLYMEEDKTSDYYNTAIKNGLSNVFKEVKKNSLMHPTEKQVESLYCRYIYELQEALKIYYVRNRLLEAGRIFTPLFQPIVDKIEEK